MCPGNLQMQLASLSGAALGRESDLDAVSHGEPLSPL